MARGSQPAETLPSDATLIGLRGFPDLPAKPALSGGDRGRLAGAEIHASSAELGHLGTWAGGAFEHVLLPGELETLEAGGHDRGLELCVEQSSGYSVRPEVDVALRPLRYRAADRDVGDLESAARPQHAEHLAEHQGLVR